MKPRVRRSRFPKRRVTRAVAQRELAVLEAAYPQAVTALEYVSPFTLLIAVILSAQSTDARVNLTTPHLFAAYPTPRALGEAKQSDVEAIVRSCGFFRMKAKNIIAAAQRDRDAVMAARFRATARRSKRYPASAVRRRTSCSPWPSKKRRSPSTRTSFASRIAWG